MNDERDQAETAAHQRRRLVRSCFAGTAYADGPDAARGLRLAMGGVAVSVLMALAVTADRGLVHDSSRSPRHLAHQGSRPSASPEHRDGR